MDRELDGLWLTGGVDPSGPVLETKVEGVPQPVVLLVDDGAAGQQDVTPAPGIQQPGEEVGGEPVIGIGEGYPVSSRVLHSQVAGPALPTVVGLNDLDVEVCSPGPGAADSG